MHIGERFRGGFREEIAQFTYRPEKGIFFVEIEKVGGLSGGTQKRISVNKLAHNINTMDKLE